MPFPGLEASDAIFLGFGLDMSIIKVPLSSLLVITRSKGWNTS